jgi:hypothetical protein
MERGALHDFGLLSAHCGRARRADSPCPDTLHRKLKGRAAAAGQTLSDCLLAEIERLAARPTREEMLARLHSRRRVTLKTAAAALKSSADARCAPLTAAS